jgi:hypothetical protein
MPVVKILYSAPVIVLSVMLVWVPLALVGADGAAGPSALVMAAVAAEVTEPVAPAVAVTTTLMALPISAATSL